MALDNSTLADKVRLRRRVLARLPAPPVVLETHGGFGRIYERTWFKARTGVVLEKDPRKAEHLAVQRPTWRVYQGDCERAIAAGLAADVAFDIIDLDHYGEPFTMLGALSKPGRKFPDVWHLVVNDGTRQATMRGVSWKMEALAGAVRRHGANLYPKYLQVARECMEDFAGGIGFRVSAWEGYYTGKNGMMTHYHAVMSRIAAPK